MTATETKTVVEVSIKMRLGKADDFKVEYTDFSGPKPILKEKLKIGQPYWLRSQVDGSFDNRNYIITEDTDTHEFADYLTRKMVYVPLSYFELLELNQ